MPLPLPEVQRAMSTSSKATPDDREAVLATTLVPDGMTPWLAIAEDACLATGAPLGDVLAMRRHPHAVRARARAWAVLLDLGYSYPEIARGWCCDHSTVIDVVRVHEPDAAARRTAASRKRPGLAKAKAQSTEASAPAAACG